MTYGHLQADCLYTGISSGPNARCRVWEALTFTFTHTMRPDPNTFETCWVRPTGEPDQVWQGEKS